MAPYFFAVLTLSNKLADKAKEEVFDPLKGAYDAVFDTTGSIGKRYRREDAIGTPYCLTYDFQSLDDHQVTVRERDPLTQERVPIKDLAAYLASKYQDKD